MTPDPQTKVVTVRQPWASLVALGVKTIETRSWSTRYRGRLLIHAGAKMPPVTHSVGGWMPVSRGFGQQTRMQTRDRESEHYGLVLPMPLGAVVASCTLVDVVPIDGSGHGSPNHTGDRLAEFPHDGPMPHQLGGLWITGPRIGAPTRVEDQRPYGDFAPGRFAWLLEDIQPIDPPLPAKGKQGLWTWTPATDGPPTIYQPETP